MRKGSTISPRRGRGFSYLKWASLTVLAIFLLLLLSAWCVFRSQRRKWTEDRSIQVELPVGNSARPVDGARLYRDTRRALESGAAQNLQFDNQELNALLSQAPELQGLGAKMALQLQEDSLLTRMSVPLDGIPGFSGRFLNGDFVFDMQIDQGTPQLRLLSGNVRGKEVPRRFLEQINQYARRELTKQLQAQTDLRRVESLRIKDGKLAVKIRAESK